MGRTKQQQRDASIAEYRRRKVAALRLRGLSLYEIVEALSFGEGQITNPKTGQPFGKSTIDRDLDALEAEWRVNAAGDMAEHKARQLAELREARRRAWSAGAAAEVRQNLALEMKLLGTAEPDQVKNSGETVIRIKRDSDRYNPARAPSGAAEDSG